MTCFFHISQTIDWIELKIFEHVSIINMHLPIEKFWSMDAWISRKTKNGWRWWRPISWKPCTRICWNCLCMLPSSICISPWSKFLNGCTDIEKMKKCLKVMEANFLETMHWNFLKLIKHVTIIHMHLPLKHLSKWMLVFKLWKKWISALCIFVSCSKTKHLAVF